MTRGPSATLRVVGVVLAGALVACSVSDATHADAGAPACKRYSACTLLTSSDVAHALGGTMVGAGVPNDVNTSTTSSLPEEVDCDYAPGGAVIHFALSCDSQNIVDRRYPDVFTSIDGVGDQAYWQRMTPDGGAAAGKLAAWVGEHIEIDLTLAPPGGGSFSVDPEQAAVEMATAAIPRL